MKRPLIIAHRGASGYEPENTLRAFEKALDMGSDGIELDVHLCKSGELVVIHDDTVNRTTNGTGLVRSLPYDALKTFDAGKGQHIPLLSQVLDLVDTRMLVIIEIKDPYAVEDLAQLISSYLKKGWSPDNFLVCSFNWDAIERFAPFVPVIAVGLLFEENYSGDIVTTVKQHKAQYAIVNYHDITSALIQEAHQEHVQVLAYTINDKAIAQKLSAMHIDGIITDYPDILQKSE